VLGAQKLLESVPRRRPASFGRHALGIGVGLCLALTAEPAWCLEKSELEERAVARAIGRDVEREPNPEGQLIESVEIVRQPVFDEDDPIPDLVNVIHAQTREHVIARELLFRAGDTYATAIVEETLRNLQVIPQFGVVVIVALRGKAPGSVRLVVIVRDIWSLRLNSQLQGTPTNITYLFVNPLENNLFGLRAQLGVQFALQPDRYTVGVLGSYPRLFGSRVDASGVVNVHVNTESGESEGSVGSFALHQDLVALSDKWAFLVGGAWSFEQTRLLESGGVRIDYGWPPSARIFTQPFLSHGQPIEYATHVVRTGGEVSRAFGVRNKTILTWGVELIRRKFEATRAADVAPRDFAAFVREEVPVSDARLSPFAQIEHRSTRYLATRDVETLELQESFALGQMAALRVYPAARGLGSSRDLLGTVAWLGYTWPLGDGLLRAVASSSIETANDAKHQGNAQGALRAVSPKLRFFRAVLDAALVSTHRNYLNRKLVLGGESRPRGYMIGAFRADSGFAGSLELRSVSIDIWSARVGGVMFYDLGGVGNTMRQAFATTHYSDEALGLRQSVGLGARVLFPQINRASFRVDWAAPLTPGRGRKPDRPLPGAIYFTFGQAFDVPRLKLPQILGSETTVLDLSP
jgi:Omp85 superfamily domain